MMRDENARRDRPEPSIDLSSEAVARMVATAFPSHRVVDARILTGGLCNTNVRILLDPETDPIVLRIYDRDPDACWKEVDILRLVSAAVPVPEVTSRSSGSLKP